MSKVVIPKGYKRTKLGTIPDQWTVKKLGDLVVYKKGYAFKSASYKTKGIRIIRISDTNAYSIHNEDPVYLDETEGEVLADYRLEQGDLIVTSVGSRPPLYSSMVGKVIRVPDNFEKSLLNQNVVRIRSIEDFNQIFLFYNVKTERYLNFIEGIVRGNANQVSITLDDLFKYLLPNPPLQEQQNIANILSKSDELIDDLQLLIDKKKESKKGLMQQLLTGKKRFPGFNDKWKKIKLSDIAKIKKGTQINKLNLADDGIYYVLNGGITPSGYTEEWNTKENTISISEGGNSCGYVNFNIEKFWSGGHLYTLEDVSEEVLIPFLFQSLKFNENKIMNLRVGSGLPNIQMKSIEKFEIKIPSVDEQTLIANTLSKADEEIELLEKELEQYKLVKKSLMQKLLTGEVRTV